MSFLQQFTKQSSLVWKCSCWFCSCDVKVLHTATSSSWSISTMLASFTVNVETWLSTSNCHLTCRPWKGRSLLSEWFGMLRAYKHTHRHSTTVLHSFGITKQSSILQNDAGSAISHSNILRHKDMIYQWRVRVEKHRFNLVAGWLIAIQLVSFHSTWAVQTLINVYVGQGAQGHRKLECIHRHTSDQGSLATALDWTTDI